jgi:APA family basic amino acid/polyamine antiporter
LSKKKLSLFDSIALIVTLIIGAGIFETAPLVARGATSAYGVLVLWIIGGLISLSGALVYSELATTYPEDGGDYAYLKRTYGEKVGYLFSWGRMIIVQPGSIAGMALLFSKYFIDFLLSLGINVILSQIQISTIAILSLTLINSYRENRGRMLQNLIAILKFICLLLLFSVVLISPNNFMKTQSLESGYSFSSLNLSMILILFTYGGWNELAFLTKEIKDPNRNIMSALCIGLLLVCLLYVLANFSFLYALGYEGVVNSTNVTMETVGLVFPRQAQSISNLIVCLACLGATHGLIFTGSRIANVIGDSISIASKLGFGKRKYGIPIDAYVIQGILSCIIVFCARSFSQSIVYTTTIVWLFFTLTGLSLFILRKHNPDRFRPYEVFFYPITPIIFCCVSFYLTISAFIYDPLGSAISVLILLGGLLLRK